MQKRHVLFPVILIAAITGTLVLLGKARARSTVLRAIAIAEVYTNEFVVGSLPLVVKRITADGNLHCTGVWSVLFTGQDFRRRRAESS